MSKLKIVFVTVAVVLSSFGAYCLFFHIPKNQKIVQHSEHHTGPQGNRRQMLGKGRGPVIVNIEEVQKDGKIIELKGMIKSQLPDLKVEWKLPEGAKLISGDLETSAEKNSDNTYNANSIKVDVSGSEEKPIVFLAYKEKDGERMGHSRVYQWYQTVVEAEHIEKIRARMKSRRARPIR